MIVVSNTSPLTNLAAIDQFDLLRELYSQIYIPEGVWDELNAEGQKWPGSAEVEQADWIHRQKPQNQTLVDNLLRDLDRGEAETIALAIELRCDRVVIDERDGRRFAQRHNLSVIGTVGLLIDAKNRGLRKKIKPSLDALRQKAGFYLSETLYQEILGSLEES
jgi:hypothetical protein